MHSTLSHLVCVVKENKKLIKLLWKHWLLFGINGLHWNLEIKDNSLSVLWISYSFKWKYSDSGKRLTWVLGCPSLLSLAVIYCTSQTSQFTQFSTIYNMSQSSSASSSIYSTSALSAVNPVEDVGLFMQLGLATKLFSPSSYYPENTQKSLISMEVTLLGLKKQYYNKLIVFILGYQLSRRLKDLGRRGCSGYNMCT